MRVFTSSFGRRKCDHAELQARRVDDVLFLDDLGHGLFIIGVVSFDEERRGTHVEQVRVGACAMVDWDGPPTVELDDALLVRRGRGREYKDDVVQVGLVVARSGALTGLR